MVSGSESSVGVLLEALPATKLVYFDDMWQLQAHGRVLSVVEDGDRLAVIMNQTIMYPQGGGQPCDTGNIISVDSQQKFRVEDVRSKSGLVYHYGYYEVAEGEEATSAFQKGEDVTMVIDGERRSFNSRLHTAGHLLDACMSNVGLTSFEPGKGHHFPDGPFVEYKGTIPAPDIEKLRAALEAEANRLVSAGGQVSAVVKPYLEAAAFCGGVLPDYIPKESCPRVVSLGDNPGCPCGGTHVYDIKQIGHINVTQIRVRKGTTKVSYKLKDDGLVSVA
ncbi:unnamed protein product [Sphagnum jensenii]|uniref:Alanyl-transfer RNA synthetases family profile domain-containing protein n=1 Tax=Sphagnum jensenii TaxID=128206 RepID=A0ABP1B5I3_9BRYO